jgi:two-component system chemotaxis response regulator CheB
MVKKILVVDDSALMRRVLCDIINEDSRFEVVDTAANGLIALEKITKHTYDAVVLDVNMPKMDGITFLKELQKRNISAKIMMASTETRESSAITIRALELGALDFVEKPGSFLLAQNDHFKDKLVDTLAIVVNSSLPKIRRISRTAPITKKKIEEIASIKKVKAGKRIVAIASSTGGPRALQQVITILPKCLNAPVVIVQHMPKGFTASFAERLDTLSEADVKEAEENDVLEKGKVYIARGGSHLKIYEKGGKSYLRYSDEPVREGVKPSANYMYESLMDTSYDEILCVVLTGMGADGTEGIKNLREKKKLGIVAQDEETCTVYGMPRSIVKTGLVDEVKPIEEIAKTIIEKVGVESYGC